MRRRIPTVSFLPSLSVLLLILLVVLHPVYAQLCYNPDGSISNDRPCDSSAAVSVCCEDGFVCTENKLCQPMGWYDGSDGNPLQLIRSTCTDKTWKSGSCPGHCIAESPTGGEWVMRCGNTSSEYCCSDDSCCSNGGKRYNLGNATKTAIAGRQAPTTTTSTTSQSSTSTTSAASTATTTTEGYATTTTPAPSETASERSTSNSQTLKIGLGVGLGVGGGLIVLGSLALFFWHRRRTRAAAAHQTGYLSSHSTSLYMAEHPKLVSELDTRDPRVLAELQGRSNRDGLYEVE